MTSKNCNAMKKIFTKMMLWAVAATAIVSCENNFNDTTVNGDTNLVKVTLTADKPTVVSVNRTELDNEGQPLWSVGDQIGAYAETGVDGEGKTTYGNYSLTNDNETEATATTTFTGETALANTLYVYYPYVAGDAINDKGVVKANLLSAQTPSATSFDGKADIMIAKPVTLDEAGNQLSNLEFARLGAIVKVVLKDNTGSLAEEYLSSLTMTTANDIAGKVYLDAINQELGTLYDDTSRSKSVTANYTTATHFVVNGENAVYFVVYPTTLASGSTVSFTAQTDNYNISKSIALPSEIALESGVVTTLNVSLAAEHIEEIETTNWVDNAYNLVLNTKDLAVGDKVVIAAADYSMALSTTQSTNNRDAAEITKNPNNTIEIDNTVEVLTLVEGSVEGTFAFKTSDNKYLYAASSGSNYLRSQTTIDANASFLVTITDGIASVTAQGANTRNIMQYNNQYTIFSCYNAAQLDICIYKLVGEYTMPPVLTVNVESITSISHEGENVTFVYSVANPVEGTSVVITDNADWLTTTDNNGTVTATVEANETEEERKATITVKYGDLTKTVAIQQNAKPGEGGDVAQKYTVTYTITSTTSCTTSGTAPTGSTAAFKNTYTSNKEQVTSGNSATFTLGGYTGATITGMTLKMHSNASKGAGKFSVVAGTTTLAAISTATKFDQWYDNNRMETDYRDVNVTLTNSSYVVGSGENVVVKIEATTNSLFIQSITIEYTIGGSSEGGDTPETPAPVLAVTSATTINVASAGDVPTITYSITNPVEGKSVTALADQTWVNEFDYTVAGEVSFLVDANTGAAREATVTLSYEGAESKTVTISQAAGNTGGGETAKVWTLVTNASTLQAGDQIIIACNSKGVTASNTIVSGTNPYLDKITSTFSSDKTTITSVGSGTAILTLGGSTGAWTLTNESGKLLGATAAKKVAWGSGTTTWAISISNNNATIQNGTSSYGRFLYNVSSPRFTPYASGTNVSSTMLLPQIYRLQ